MTTVDNSLKENTKTYLEQLNDYEEWLETSECEDLSDAYSQMLSNLN